MIVRIVLRNGLTQLRNGQIDDLLSGKLKTVENHHFEWVNQLGMVIFNSKLLKYHFENQHFE
jgi:hypothetical protein